mmetsp:Transcript_24472/g.45237  ORF Transcript_24472/g.45237 Transcript_24472/m.45237 type:complete len:408 (+) Transcript_24472:155-1378(+)
MTPVLVGRRRFRRGEGRSHVQALLVLFLLRLFVLLLLGFDHVRARVCGHGGDGHERGARLLLLVFGRLVFDGGGGRGRGLGCIARLRRRCNLLALRNDGRRLRLLLLVTHCRRLHHHRRRRRRRRHHRGRQGRHPLPRHASSLLLLLRLLPELLLLLLRAAERDDLLDLPRGVLHHELSLHAVQSPDRHVPFGLGPLGQDRRLLQFGTFVTLEPQALLPFRAGGAHVGLGPAGSSGGFVVVEILGGGEGGVVGPVEAEGYAGGHGRIVSGTETVVAHLDAVKGDVPLHGRRAGLHAFLGGGGARGAAESDEGRLRLDSTWPSSRRRRLRQPVRLERLGEVGDGHARFEAGHPVGGGGIVIHGGTAFVQRRLEVGILLGGRAAAPGKDGKGHDATHDGGLIMEPRGRI